MGKKKEGLQGRRLWKIFGRWFRLPKYAEVR